MLETVATVLTACGIETFRQGPISHIVLFELQQCLPLAVLKLQRSTFLRHI